MTTAQRVLLAAIAIAWASESATAEDRYSTVESFSRAVASAGATEIKTVDGQQDLDSDGIADDYGVLLYLPPGEDIYKGRVFVLLGEKGKGYLLSGLSSEFVCCDQAKTYAEIAEKKGKLNFYIQINESGYCGGAQTIFRFKQIDGRWRVTGRDYSEGACSAREITTGIQSSVNFLTGQTSDEARPRKFPKFFLDDFDPWSEKYLAPSPSEPAAGIP